MSFGSLSIARKLGLGFFVMVLIMGMTTAFGVVQVQKVSQGLKVINDQNSVKQRYAINYRGSVHNRAISLRDVVLDETTAAIQTDLDEIATLSAAYTASETKMNAMFADKSSVSPEEVADLAGIDAVQARTLPLITKVVELRQAGQAAEAKQVLLEQARPAFNDWLASINKLIDLEEAMNKSASTEARAIADTFRLTMIVLLGLATVLAIGVALVITRSIRRPLAEASEVLTAFGTGDLTRRMDDGRRDEFGTMATSMNTTLGTLGEVLTAFRATAEGLTDTSGRIGAISGRIAVGAVDSARQAQIVATAADDVSRSVQVVEAGATEMGASISQISHNAHEASNVAAQAVEVAKATNETMTTLGESSRQIGDVVKLITSIAEQTNLLALNATIEAARAGEAGKGFAVVASEVKDLAQETARATQDISSRVGTIQANTTQALETISEITTVIERINDIQATIAAAVEEQTATTSEMTRTVGSAASASANIASGIEEVANVARSTSQSVAESQAAVGELDEVSARLHALVARFRF